MPTSNGEKHVRYKGKPKVQQPIHKKRYQGCNEIRQEDEMAIGSASNEEGRWKLGREITEGDKEKDGDQEGRTNSTDENGR